MVNNITLKSEELKDICSKILTAVDSNGLSEITETLELVLIDKVLYLNVTNREYFVKIKLLTNVDGDFHATVHAELFLKLISKITTELVTLEIKDNSLLINGNGTYKLPMVYNGNELLTLPKIEIINETNSFTVPGSILNSIYIYNSKQFAMGNIVNPIQSLYYVDEQGAITFTTGATVNKFSISNPIKLLFNSKLVKLFKLFKKEDIQFKIGQDQISADIIQTKVKFISSNIELTAILPMNDSEVNKVPVQAIRDRAFKDYDNTVVINREELLQTINRLSIFSYSSTSVDRTFSIFEFSNNDVTIKDINKINSETIKYSNSINLAENYTCVLDFNDIKLVLETTSDEFINLSFGDHQAIVCSRNNIYNVIPEIN